MAAEFCKGAHICGLLEHTGLGIKWHTFRLSKTIELFYNRHSDTKWLEKSLSAFATDSQYTIVPLGITLPGAEGNKQVALFFAEAFPDGRVEVTNKIRSSVSIRVMGPTLAHSIFQREIFQRRGAGQNYGSVMS